MASKIQVTAKDFTIKQIVELKELTTATATQVAAWWKLADVAKRRTSICKKLGNDFTLSIAGTRTTFTFHVDGTVSTTNGTKQIRRDNQPMHMGEPVANRKVVGFVNGKFVYA